ncbi:MAG: efflux RND transporter periplasmic adaptor subunit [Oscillospiraceae bacterium]
MKTKIKMVLSAFCAVVLLAGCNQPISQPQVTPAGNDATRITTEIVQKKSLNTSLEREGEMRPMLEKQVIAPIDGTIETIDVALGQKVEVDTPLYTIDDTDLKNNLQVQASYLEIAQINLSIVQATGASTRVAELQVEIAQKNYNTAKKNAAYASVTAPAAGVVVMLDAEVGDLARETSIIIADLDKAILTIHVGEDVIESLSVGNEINATAFSAPGVYLSGRVISANPYYYVGGKGYPVELEIDLEGTDIQPYGGVSVSIVGTFNEEVVVVPIKAISTENDITSVFVVNSDGTVSLRAIQVGYTTDDSAVVTEGLREGEEIAVSGIRLLKDGAKVVVE